MLLFSAWSFQNGLTDNWPDYISSHTLPKFLNFYFKLFKFSLLNIGWLSFCSSFIIILTQMKSCNYVDLYITVHKKCVNRLLYCCLVAVSRPLLRQTERTVTARDYEVSFYQKNYGKEMVNLTMNCWFIVRNKCNEILNLLLPKVKIT